MPCGQRFNIQQKTIVRSIWKNGSGSGVNRICFFCAN
jgi:hypothetical protein